MWRQCIATTSITLPSAVSLRDALFPEWVSTDDIRGTFIDVTIDTLNATADIDLGVSTTIVTDFAMYFLTLNTSSGNSFPFPIGKGATVSLRITFSTPAGDRAVYANPAITSSSLCIIS